MYRPTPYIVDDASLLHALIRKRAFATIVAVVDEAPAFAYAPVIVDETHGPLGALRFHVAKANPLAALDAVKVRFSFLGPDAYVSPDWYGREGFVPTWNYIAIEASGVVERQDREALRQVVVDLSAEHEKRLLPKKPWTLDKLSAQKTEALLNAIVGFRVELETLEGKFKLSQDKPGDAFAGVVDALEKSDDATDRAVAVAMRQYVRKE